MNGEDSACVDTSSTRVLYVEDDPTEIYLVKEILGRKFYPFVFDFVSSMVDALEAYDPAVHKLVVTDYNLGDAEAPQVAAALLERFPGVCIVCYSGAYTDSRIHAAEAAGIAECWTKGHPADFVARVFSVLENMSS